MTARDVTLILPYYENPQMLLEQVQRLQSAPEKFRKHLHLIVVDDGSPKYPLGQLALGVLQGIELASVALYRILVDVRWNWIAARNLAVSEAKTDWILMTDIDHLVPDETLQRVLEGDLSPKDIYRFSRVDAPDLTPYKPHPNSWLMTRKMFSRTGGYDERFSGYYGTDGMFRDRCTAACRNVVMLEAPLIRVPREVIPDASTTTYGRKEPQDKEGVQRIRREIANDPKPRQLTFPWEQIL